jgi:hypothetical protein
MHLLIIDRFEGDWAVLDHDGTTFNFPRDLLPDGAKEGDVLELGLQVNKDATLERRQHIRKLEDELFD